jgi:antitoxin ParD1/3/4
MKIADLARQGTGMADGPEGSRPKVTLQKGAAGSLSDPPDIPMLALAVNSIKYHKLISRGSTMASSYSIGDHFERLIQSLIESGRYSTASEVMREGLRLLEEREERRRAKLEALRTEIQKGFDSGPAEEVGDMFERIKSEGRKRLAAKNGK